MNSLYHVTLYDGQRFVAAVSPRKIERTCGIVRLEVDLEPIGVVHVEPPVREQCPFGLANVKPIRHQPTKEKP